MFCAFGAAMGRFGCIDVVDNAIRGLLGVPRACYGPWATTVSKQGRVFLPICSYPWSPALFLC